MEKWINNNHILITGIDGQAGRSAVTYFRERGFPIIGTDIIGIAPQVESFYIIPLPEDPSYSKTLMDIIKKERPTLLIPTVTEELHVISRLKRAIEGEGCMVFISPPNVIDTVNDRLKTAMIMAGHGVSVPTSFDEKTPRGLIIKELGLPLLSKHRFGSGVRGVTLYSRPEELFQETRAGIIFQELIPGEEFDINLFLDKRGDVQAAVVLKKSVLKEGVTGNVLSVERVERDDIKQLGIRIARILNMEGPVTIEIRLRGDGTPVLLEIHARLGENVLFAREILDSLATVWSEKGATAAYI